MLRDDGERLARGVCFGFNKGLRRRRGRFGRGDRWLDRWRCGRLSGLLDRVDPERVRDVLFQRRDQVAGRKAGRRLAHLVKTVLQVGHLGFAHGFLELALEFGGHLARLAHPLPEGAQDPRQLLRANGDQRDDRDENEFTPPDVEHSYFRLREPPRAIRADTRWDRLWSRG